MVYLNYHDTTPYLVGIYMYAIFRLKALNPARFMTL